MLAESHAYVRQSYECQLTALELNRALSLGSSVSEISTRHVQPQCLEVSHSGQACTADQTLNQPGKRQRIGIAMCSDVDRKAVRGSFSQYRAVWGLQLQAVKIVLESNNVDLTLVKRAKFHYFASTTTVPSYRGKIQMS